MREKVIDLLLVGGLIGLALFVYTWHGNVEFQGDDDVIYLREHVGFTKILQGLLPALVTQPSVALAKGKALILHFFFQRHCSAPPLLFGMCYWGMETLGIPFTLFTFHLPVCLPGVAACALFYLLLRREALGRPMALLGGLLLVVSPLVVMANRGIATYFAAVIPFTQVLALLALQRPATDSRWRVRAGAAMLLVTLSDILFFVSLPVLVGAVIFREGCGRTSGTAWRSWLSQLVKRLAPLGARVIVYPTALAIVLALVFTHMKCALPDRFGSQWTPIFRIVCHTSEAGLGPLFRPQILFEYLAVLLGELFPLVLVLGLVVAVLTRGKAFRGVVGTYAVVASSAYGLVFYVLSAPAWGVKNLYQIYLAVPLVLFVLLAADSIRRATPRARPTIVGVLVLVLLSAGTSMVSYIWKVPVSVTRAPFAMSLYGTKNTNYGTKGTGMLVRALLEDLVRRDPDSRVDVTVLRCPRWTSLVTFAGLNWSAEYYRARFGARGISVDQGPNQKSAIREAAGAAPTCVLLDVRTHGEGAPHTEQLKEPGALQSAVQFDIMGAESTIATLLVRGLPRDSLPLPPGPYPLAELEETFDRRYRALDDFIP